ncbi:MULTISPECIES: META domain-containing protein [Nocardia]|uniref:META domain-containing protein n=1 Tax=Nocardia TaxID=1817 RepID=UPI000D690AEA|nr:MULTISPECIES: META domain-containing protein [Nocardia]
MSFARLAPLLLLTALAAVGCSDNDPDSASSSSTPPSTATTSAAPTTNTSASTPMGHTYVSTTVQGTPIPGDGPLTLTFTDNRVSAYAGCNTASGSVTFDGDVLRVGDLASTLIGCPEPQAGADQWMNTLLTAAPTWRLEGTTLTLRDKDQTVTLVDRKVASPDKPLKGTDWVVTEIITRDARTTSQTLAETRPTLLIAEDGTVSGTTGCNRMTGTADIDPSGSPVTFRLATTRMACPPEVMEVESAVLSALDGTATADIDADTLTLRNKNNDTGLVLHAT